MTCDERTEHARRMVLHLCIERHVNDAIAKFGNTTFMRTVRDDVMDAIRQGIADAYAKDTTV
jgi:hypothetical protein